MELADARPNGTGALERGSAGKRLSREEILALYASPVEEVVAAAHEARLRQTDPRIVTYDVGGNIDYTNVCTVACKFCTFYAAKHEAGAFTLTNAEIGRQMEIFRTFGVREIQVQGGVNPDLPFEWYLDLLRYLKSEYPAVHINAFSTEEILGLEKVTGRTALDLLTHLRNAGLDGMPGAAAEILVDEVRHCVAPARIRTKDWFRIVDTALEVGLYIPWVSMVTGFGETRAERVEHLLALRAAQDQALDRYGRGYAAFKVWPVRLEHTRLKDKIPQKAPGEIEREYLREVAIARLALNNVRNHRAVWRTMGFGVAAAALRSGANDLCGSGSINAVDSVLEKAGRPVTDTADVLLRQVDRCIYEAGFVAAPRDAYYNVLMHQENCPAFTEGFAT